MKMQEGEPWDNPPDCPRDSSRGVPVAWTPGNRLNGFSWFSAYSFPSMNRGVNENRIFIRKQLNL
jgi:hypothetical protein